MLMCSVAPDIADPPDNTSVVNGSVTEFNCTATSDPLPSIG